ncbi:MAG TPA: single-stranded-DNA-specific exonuclease RecJ [Bacilli bacterium]
MLQSRARWIISDCDHIIVQQLKDRFKISEFLAKLLVVRGITGEKEVELFLSGGQEHFHDPFLFDGMKEAVDRIHMAIAKKQKIRIYGDYDADGVSSTSLMMLLFQELGANFDYYIPHRTNEGYGLNIKAVDLANHDHVNLIVTVDNGISAYQEIEYAASLGIEVIVTDHHEPPGVLPNALAVINPKKPGCSYPFKELAGVGVAFKLAQALTGRVPLEFIEIAAIGTVADLMQLVGENRLIVKLGLQRMQNSAHPGIKALLQLKGDDTKEITAMHIGYSIAPRINASGRLGSAESAVKLLTAADGQAAAKLAMELDLLNKERQSLVEEMTQQAAELLEHESKPGKYKVIVLAQQDWNVGVVGIVAAKILDKHYCPVIILSIDPTSGLAKGSARSIPGFDMYQALKCCEEYLDHYGGHQAAAGMTLSQDKIPLLRDKLNALAEDWLTEEDYSPLLKADMVCSLEDITVDYYEQIQGLAPYGMGNPSPKFIFQGMNIKEIRTMGKEQQHLKLICSDNPQDMKNVIEVLGFGKGKLCEQISPLAQVDVFGELSINEWNGVRKPQILIQDIRILHTQVFDWRGKQANQHKIYPWFSSLSSNRQFKGEHAILLSAADERKQLPEAFETSNHSIWTLDGAAGILPVNNIAHNIDIYDITDLYLYSIPGSLSLLKNGLPAFPSAQRIYAMFTDLSHKAAISLPTRDTFKKVYTLLQQQGQWEADNIRIIDGISTKSGVGVGVVEFIIEVFEQLHFIKRNADIYVCDPTPPKKDLAASKIYEQRSLLRSLREESEQTLIFSTAKELVEWIMNHRMRDENKHLLEEMA